MKILRNIKWALWSLRSYRKIVVSMRPWDYAYVLRMMRFQLTVLADHIEHNKRHVGYESTVSEIREVCAHIDAYMDIGIYTEDLDIHWNAIWDTMADKMEGWWD